MRAPGGGSPRRSQGASQKAVDHGTTRLAFGRLPPKRRACPFASPEVFTIPSGAPFLPTLSHALLDGALIDGFPGSGGAMALADATIYVPTQRAAEALAEALLVASGERSLILPRIAPLGAFEPDEAATAFAAESDEAPPRSALPRAVGDLARRHVLATMTRAWGKALGGAIRTVDGDGRLVVDPAEPALVATTPAQAYALAGDLAALIDDMIIEGAPWSKIEALAPDAYDPYWRITLDFLKIAFARWPEWLAEHGLIDRATRIALLIDDEIKALEGGARRGPTIIAGSTGANRATARLIAAIARAPQGAVVLPGLDLDLDDGAWAMIGASGEASLGLAGHPQWLMRRLIGEIGVNRGDVRPLDLDALSATRAARSAFLTEALRPAGSTERWRDRDGAACAAGRRGCARRRYDRRRRQRNRGGAGAGDRDARNPGNAGQDGGPRDPRSVDRAPGGGGAQAMGRRGRGFGGADARAEPRGRARAAHA